MALLSVAVVLFVCSIGHILAQECPDGITTKLVTGDLELELPLTVPACIRCGYIVGFDLVNPTDVTWATTIMSGSTPDPLTNGTGGVLIDPNTTTLILNNPGDVISVGRFLRCYSAQAQTDGHSTGEHIIKILAFNFLNPLISPNDSTVSVVEGSNLILSCDDPGNSGMTSYQWFSVNGSELSNRETTPPALLTFNNIQRTSSGVYICRSTKTNIDMIRESTVTINIQYPPITSITTSYDGSVFIINCTFDGNPPPSVTWLHNGAPLNINQLTINTHSTYSELIMNTNYSGTYVCTANNTISHDTSNPITISGMSPVESITTTSTTPTQPVTITHSAITSSGTTLSTSGTVIASPGGVNQPTTGTVVAIVTVIGVVILLSILAVLISIAVYYYYAKFKKTDSSYHHGSGRGVIVAYASADEFEQVDLKSVESIDDIVARPKSRENVDIAIPPPPYEDLTFTKEIAIPNGHSGGPLEATPEIGGSVTESDITMETNGTLDRLINTPEMKSDRIVYAELTNFPSAKETRVKIKNKPVDNEAVIYSELSVAQQQASQGQPSYEKALYADIGHFTPKDKKNKEPKPSNVDKVIYSELDSIRKPPHQAARPNYVAQPLTRLTPPSLVSSRLTPPPLPPSRNSITTHNDSTAADTTIFSL